MEDNWHPNDRIFTVMQLRHLVDTLKRTEEKTDRMHYLFILIYLCCIENTLYIYMCMLHGQRRVLRHFQRGSTEMGSESGIMR